jgi:hypothetical protein
VSNQTQGKSDEKIYTGFTSIRIIANIEFDLPAIDFRSRKEILVDTEELEWHDYDEDNGCLTLEEISTQLIEKGYQSPFYVWTELGLSGKIYMYGNYEPPAWVEHGTTRGYA